MRCVRDASAESFLWLASGPDAPLEGGSIWTHLERALQSESAAACLSCDGLTISRLELQVAIAALAWKPTYRRVGIAMSRSISAVVATLAAWKHDGIYVPIAVEYPALQMQAVADGCTLDVVVTDRLLTLRGYREVSSQVGIDGTVLRFHERVAATRGTAGRVADRGLCYIAHTSGSSGAPKGVRISHAALLNRIAAMREFLEIRPDDRFLYKIPTLFDVHVWEFVLPIMSGCLLVIYREASRFCVLAVAELITDERITIVGLPPALLSVLLKTRRFVEENVLRTVMCGGEAWAPQVARDFHAKLPGRTLYNSYGPTETTMVVTNWRVPDRPGLQEICLGQPHRNTLLVLEEHERTMTPQGMQVTGELLVGGVQVALGYVSDAAASRFGERVIDGRSVRLYATGDLVRLDVETGALCFQRRQDNQVKINGVRIELDEVEDALRSIPVVDGCVAFVTTVHGTTQLWSCFTTTDDRAVEIDLIRAECARRLSRYKIPAVLRHVATLPVRANGKIDRDASVCSSAATRIERLPAAPSLHGRVLALLPLRDDPLPEPDLVLLASVPRPGLESSCR